MLGLAFAILNVRRTVGSRSNSYGTKINTTQSWTALSASLSLSLPSGGSASVVWGMYQLGLLSNFHEPKLTCVARSYYSRNL